MGKKSKKVIARVMAVLMAFSLLPFDFWGTASVVRAEELSEKYVEAEASSTAETAIAETDTAEADEESSSAANSESEEPTEQDSAVSEDVETEEEEETDSAKVEDVETAGDEEEVESTEELTTEEEADSVVPDDLVADEETTATFDPAKLTVEQITKGTHYYDKTGTKQTGSGADTYFTLYQINNTANIESINATNNPDVISAGYTNAYKSGGLSNFTTNKWSRIIEFSPKETAKLTIYAFTQAENRTIGLDRTEDAGTAVTADKAKETFSLPEKGKVYQFSTIVEAGPHYIWFVDESRILKIIVEEGVVTPPDASVESGEVEKGQSVKLSCADENATIYYTTGTEEDFCDESHKYSSAISINDDTTIRAIAVSGDKKSDIVTFEYTIKTVAVPKASRESGDVATGAEIELSCDTEGATIYYTTDGSEPDTTNVDGENATKTFNTGDKITITKDTTIKAIAVKENWNDSEVATFDYKIETQVKTPTATPDSGTAVKRGDTVELSCETENAVIYYTTDGSKPDKANVDGANSTKTYSSTDKITITEDTTIKAIAVKENCTDSEVAEFTYTIEATKPTSSGCEHNFTTNGVSSEYFTIAGTLADDGSASYKDLTLKSYISLNASNNTVKFTSVYPGVLTLVVGEKSAADIVTIADGEGSNTYSSDGNGIVTFDGLTADTEYTISGTSGDVALYYMSVAYSVKAIAFDDYVDILSEKQTAGTQVKMDDNFTIVCHANSVVMTDKNEETDEVIVKEWSDGTKMSTYLSTGGAAKTNAASVKFSTSGAAKITVYFGVTSTAQDANERLLTILDSTGNATVTQTGTNEAGGLYKITLDLTTAGTYYLGSAKSSLLIYKIIVDESKESENPDNPDNPDDNYITSKLIDDACRHNFTLNGLLSEHFTIAGTLTKGGEEDKLVYNNGSTNLTLTNYMTMGAEDSVKFTVPAEKTGTLTLVFAEKNAAAVKVAAGSAEAEVYTTDENGIVTIEDLTAGTEYTLTKADTEAKLYYMSAFYGEEGAVSAPTAPTATPEPGAVEAETEITLAAEEGAVIYYTLDGSEPIVEEADLEGKATKTYDEETTKITIDKATTIKAVAVKEGVSSLVAVLAYTIKPSDGPDTSEKATIWVVGDSTVSAFNDTYYIPRQGYGTEIATYFNADVHNLAHSGASSKDFTTMSEYAVLKNGSDSVPKLGEANTEGKFLIIGFGHNDQKNETARYTNPNGDYKTEGSFAKSLYDNYIKLAIDAGVTPVVVTPIVRINEKNEYNNSSGHITNDADGYPGGDYAEAIRKLCAEEEIKDKVILVDLTTVTRDMSVELGYDEVKWMHAFTAGEWADAEKKEIKPTESSVDKTHTNSYGAKMNAWLIGDLTKGTALEKHWRNKAKPSYDADFAATINDKYVPIDYTPADNETLKNSGWPVYTDADGREWYGTAFGDTGGQGKITKTEEDGTTHLHHDNFNAIIGEDNSLNLSVSGNAGKFAATTEGFIFYYTRLKAGSNFTLSAKAKVNSFNANNQVSYGLMARDEVYINEYISATMGDFVAAGTLNQGKYNGFGRKSGARFYGDNPVDAVHTYITAGDAPELKIVGTSDGFSMTYGENPTVSAGFDYPLTGVDSEYIYVGFYVARNADVTFSDIHLETDGAVTPPTPATIDPPEPDWADGTEFPSTGGKVTLTAAEGVDIYYTTSETAEGLTDPTVESTKYAEAIDVTKEIYIRAVAIKGDDKSDYLNLHYTVLPEGAVVKPSAHPGSETEVTEVAKDTVVYLATTDTDVESIYYTMGSEPADPKDENSGRQLYDKETGIVITEDTTIKAVAWKGGSYSEVATFVYKISTGGSEGPGEDDKQTLKQPEAVVAPAAVNGVVERNAKISLDAEEGAAIYYTTDGTDPTVEKGKLYKDAIVVTDDIIRDNTVTIKAIAVKEGFNNSSVATFAYSVSAQSAGDTEDPKIPANPADKDTAISVNSSKIQVKAANFVENKKPQYAVTVTYTHTDKDGKTYQEQLTEGVHYTVAVVGDKQPITAGEYQLTITGTSEGKEEPVKTDLGIFVGRKTVSYSIVGKTSTIAKDKTKNIAKAKFTLNKTDVKNAVYTGTYITPRVVPDSKNTISEENYIIVYKNNVNVGKASVTIVGTGEYYGSKTLTFSIKKGDISKVSIEASNLEVSGSGKARTANTEKIDGALTYKGSAITLQNPVLKLDDVLLNPRTDYSITYKNNAKAGDATATIKGINNLSGTITVKYKIKTVDGAELKSGLAEYDDTNPLPAEYSSKGARLTSITVSGVTLKEGTDYKVNYKGCSASAIDSTGKVKITGAGSYKNVFKDVTVSIKTVAGKYHIKDGLTVDTAKFKKNGKIDTKKLINAAKITDAAGVKVKDTEVIAFTEEDVTNTSIKVTPKTEGNFETTVLSCHVAAKLNSVKQSKNLADKYFDGVNTVTLTTTEIAEVLPGVEASDISIASYKNNNKIGSATVTIEGRPESAFYGTKNLKFKIVAAKPNLGTGAEEAPDEEEPGKLLDVWDFAGGATQIDDSGKPTEYLSEKKYNNRLTEEIMNTWYGEGVEAGSAGNNLSSFQVTNDEGVVVFEFNGNGKTNNRIRTKNTNITRFDSNSKKDADGNEYLGFVYSNSSSTSDVYLGILLEEGDIVNAVVGSNGGDSLIKFVPVDGSADAQSYEFKAGGANASIATFYAPKAGAYKMYSENEKLVVARVTVEKMESVTVSGQVTAPASLTTPYSVAFTCKETGAVKNAPVENGGYTIGLKEGYTYDVALADANGYIITNENPSITLPVGQSEFAYDISIASVDLVTVTGSIKGLAAVAGGVENPLANLKLTFKSDNIYVPEFTMSEAGEFTLVLEKGVAYAVTAEGVDDFTLETATISAAESVTADITFAAKPVYDVTIAPEGVTAEELATTKFIFSRVYVEESVKQYEEGYAYTFTGTEGIKLRDGQYEIKAEGPYTQTLTSDLKVEGAAVTKAIKFSKEPVTLWDFADENFTDVTNFKGLLMSGIQKNKTYALGGTAGELKVPVAGPCTVTASYCYNATGSIEGSVDISLVQGVDDAYGSTSKEKSSSYNYTGGEGYVTITTTATTYLTKIAVEYASDKAEYKATVTVGASGCDYTTINDALDTVRKMTREDGQRVTIEIQPGDYEEMLVIDTPNVTLKNANANPSIQPINKGVDIDASSVRVTSYYGHGYAYYSMGSDCKWNADILAVNKANGCLSFENPGTGTTSGSYWNATVVIGADGFEADGIIFENSFNQYVSKKAADDVIVPLSGAKGENVKARNSLEAGDTSVQYKDYVERAAALAIMNGYKQINFNNCSFIGRQDTLYGGTDVTAAFYDCDIYGGTDYIFGGMTAVFAKCDLVFNTNDQTDNAKNDVGYITAAQTAKDTRGYLMYNCTVTSTTPGVNTASTKVSKPGYFGRPWAANTAEALFYKTIIGKTDYNGTEESLIVAAGWTDSLSGKSGLSQEYASIELAGVDNSSKRADWSNVLKADESGNVALADGKTTVTDDTVVAAFLGSWNPFEGKDMTISNGQ